MWCKHCNREVGPIKVKHGVHPFILLIGMALTGGLILPLWLIYRSVAVKYKCPICNMEIGGKVRGRG